MSYLDERGLRTELDDMNLGKTTFVPNALGEIVSQTRCEPSALGCGNRYLNGSALMNRLPGRTLATATSLRWLHLGLSRCCS